MKKTGEILKKAREAKNLSLNEISLSLKINTRVLSAIEEGDLSKLPAKTFLRGFVQSYANFLKINVDEVLGVFAEEMGGTPRPVIMTSEDASQKVEVPDAASEVVHADSPLAKTDEPLLNEETGSKTRVIIVTVICLILLILIFVTARVVERYQRETITEEVTVTSPLPDLNTTTSESTEESTGEEAFQETPQEEKAEETPQVTETPTPAAPSTPSTPAAPSASAANPPESTKPAAETPATPPPAPAAATAMPPPAAPAPTVTPPAPKPATGKALELIIEALDNVEIEYGSATGSLRKIQLGPDRVHTIRSREGIRLKISNGGAVNLNLNGRDLGIPGDIGKPINLNY